MTDKKSHKIKVLHFIHSLSGGGAETQLCILANEKSEIVEHLIVCFDSEHQIEGFQSEKIIKIDSSPNNILTIFKYYKIIKLINPDFLHVWLPPNITIPIMILRPFVRKKVIFSYRSKMTFHRFLRYPEFILSIFFVSSVVSNNKSNFENSFVYRKLFSMKRGVVINNCVKIKSDQKWCRVSSCNEKSYLKIIFIGRLVSSKNLSLLLKALSGLSHRSDWELSIFGSGPLEGELIHMSEVLGIKDRVKFCGFSNDIFSEILKNDLLVFSTLFEGMPNALIEAMSIGLPCLVSDIPAHKSIVGSYHEFAWFSPFDAETLKIKIETLIEDCVLLDALHQSSLGFVNKFRVSDMVDKYEEFYKSLLES